jgi:hypothetical protein
MQEASGFIEPALKKDSIRDKGQLGFWNVFKGKANCTLSQPLKELFR